MSLILKMMSNENCPDDWTQKSHHLVTDVKSVQFSRDLTGAAFAHVYFGRGETPETFDIQGNVYVMNESGRTIDSFGASAPQIPADDGEGRQA